MGWFDEQLRQRRASDDEMLSLAFMQLADAVTGAHIASAMRRDGKQSEKALEEILRYYHLRVRETTLPVEDLHAELDALVRPTGMMWRDVTLQKGWHKDAIGALLGFYADDDTPVALLPGKNGSYTFIDRTSGKSRRLTNETEALFKNEGICFYRPLPSGKLTIPDLAKFLMGCFSWCDFAGVAACIDYPEEISEEEAASDLAPRIAHLAKTLADACDERAARLLQSGLRVALCGQPNVGKSSLLNALLGEEKAIVTAIPGTTRDLVEGTLMLSGSAIHMTDTAGLHYTDDPVERIGVDRARRALADADVVLLVLDMSRPLSAEDESLLRTLHGRNGCIVLNKSDLPPVLTESDLQDAADGKPILTVSASVPDSLQPLKSYLASQAAVSDQLTLTQPRHIAAARRAVAALHQAEETLRSYSVDLAGVDLQQAQMALAEIPGDEVEEKLLDEVFGRFCVGK